jgi:hypothetical protein
LYKELLGLPIAVSGCCDVTIPTFDCVTDLSQTATFNSGPLPIPGVLAYSTPADGAGGHDFWGVNQK